jgi:hypothetical protein
MKRNIIGLLAALAALAAAACQNTSDVGPDMKRELIKATATAIDLELQSYAEKLKAAEGGLGPAENAAKFKAAIAELQKERERFQAMKAEEYPAAAGKEEKAGVFEGPEAVGPIVPALKRTVPVTVRNNYQLGSLLDVEGASKSGPFYHIAGIAGGCTCVLKSGRHYDLTVYLVYRREYFGLIGDYYVYIASVTDLGERGKTGLPD